MTYQVEKMWVRDRAYARGSAVVPIEMQPDIEMTQLIGIDGLEFLARKYGLNLEEGGRYLAVERKGYQLENEINPSKVIVIEDKDQLGFSSTQVRELAKNGDSKYKELVSASIADYIERHRPYPAK